MTASLNTGDGWVTVEAGSRLHFGLLALPHAAHPTHWPDLSGQWTVPRRTFGGAGLMIQEPCLRLCIRRAAQWSARGPQAERVLAEARRVGQILEDAEGPDSQSLHAPSASSQTAYEILVQAAPPPHVGLGSGTQLALALGRAMLDLHGHAKVRATELASLVGRGRRSAIGVHGFLQGGFLVDAGQGQDSRPGRLLCRAAFPQEWKVLVILPRGQTGLFGNQELGAFAGLPERDLDLQQTDAMCRLLVLGMLPAIEDKDLTAFGEALHDYNHRAGAMYRLIQGGPYSHALTGAIVPFLRQLGVAGVGQSSWGPATFAVVDQERALWVEHKTRERFGLTAEEVTCTHASAGGAKAGP